MSFFPFLTIAHENKKEQWKISFVIKKEIMVSSNFLTYWKLKPFITFFVVLEKTLGNSILWLDTECNFHSALKRALADT